MEIKINDNYRLKSDPYNVTVEKRYISDPTKSPRWEELKAKGASSEPKEDWRAVSHHGTVSKALNWLYDYQLRTSEATSFKELLTEAQQFRKEISTKLTLKASS